MLTMTSERVTDQTHIPPPDWEALIEQIARQIVEERSPQRILQVRASLYDLLSHCIDSTTIIRTLTWKLIPKTDDALKPEVIKWAAFYEHRCKMGSKQIFHLEAFVAKYMRLYERFVKVHLGTCKTASLTYAASSWASNSTQHDEIVLHRFHSTSPLHKHCSAGMQGRLALRWGRVEMTTSYSARVELYHKLHCSCCNSTNSTTLTVHTHLIHIPFVIALQTSHAPSHNVVRPHVHRERRRANAVRSRAHGHAPTQAGSRPARRYVPCPCTLIDSPVLDLPHPSPTNPQSLPPSSPLPSKN